MLSTVHKIFIARWLGILIRAPRRCFGLSDIVAARRQGIDWLLDLNEGIDLSIYVLGAFEPRTINQYAAVLKPGAVVIDIGANIGAHTLPLAKLVGADGHVYAFEPTLYAYAKLQKNLEQNADLAKRVTALHCYLVRQAGSAVPDTVYSSWPLDGGGGLHALHGGRSMPTGDAAAVTLDDFVTQMGLSNIDLIKLDVDGAEAEVLAGARKTIAQFRPPLLVEFAPQEHEERDAFGEMVSFLASMNYTFHDFQRERVLSGELNVLREEVKIGYSINVLCLPKRGRAGEVTERAMDAHRQERGSGK